MFKKNKYIKIAIYADTAHIDSGGGATYFINIVNALAIKYDVVVFLPQSLRKENISQLFSSNIELRLNNFKFKNISIIGEVIHAVRNFLQFDIVLIKSNYIPGLTLNRQSFILVDFPLAKKLKFVEYIRNKTYKNVICNSSYTKNWIKKYWHRDAEILYPPAQIFDFTTITKKKIILSVGRFLKRGRSKQQDLLINAFIELYKSGITDYSLHLAGFVSDESYYEELVKIAEGYPIYFHVNVSNSEIRALYEDATFYWHACGVGVNTAENPGGVEHYGIAVVDALAAGCIPIAYGEGGPAEIIIDGYNGYLWDSVEDLTLKTKALIDNESLDMFSQRAYNSSQKYSQEAFSKRILELI